jgi:hypothetical protein
MKDNAMFQFLRPPVVFHDTRAFHDLRIQVFHRVCPVTGTDPEHPVHKAALYRQYGRLYLSETAGFKEFFNGVFCHFICLHQAKTGSVSGTPEDYTISTGKKTEKSLGKYRENGVFFLRIPCFRTYNGRGRI